MKNSQEKVSIPNRSGNNPSHGGIRIRFGLSFPYCKLSVGLFFLIYEQIDADTSTMHDTVSLNSIRYLYFINVELIHAFHSVQFVFLNRYVTYKTVRTQPTTLRTGTYEMGNGPRRGTWWSKESASYVGRHRRFPNPEVD